MEIDECTPRKLDAMDVDETLSTPTKKFNCDFSINEEFIDSILSKILRLSARSEKGGLTILEVYPSYPPPLLNIKLGKSGQLKTLICNITLEALECVCHCDTNLSRQLFHEESTVNCFNYLVDCYNRLEDFKRSHSKKCNTPAVKEIVDHLVLGLCSSLALLLEGHFIDTRIKNYYELLYEGLKTHSLPSGFFFEFVQYLQADAVRFQNIFSPLLLIIRNESQKGSICDGSHRSALQILSDLCEHRANANSSTRPFCNLMTHMSNWLINPMTEATGREFAKFSYLGPFLCTSLFAEDDPRMAEKLKEIPSDSLRSVVTGLQQEIDFTRTLLHKVLSLLANV